MDKAREHLLEYCLEEHPSSLVLDIGCGDGELTAELAKHFDDVIGVDSRIEDKDVENIVFKAADFSQDLDFVDEGMIDLVTSSFVFHQMSSQAIAKALSNISKYVEPGGKIIIAVPHPIRFFSSFGFLDAKERYLSDTNRIFSCSIVGSDGNKTQLDYVHHTLTDYVSMLREQGFEVEKANCGLRLLEKDSFSDLDKHPAYLLIKAMKR